MVDQSGGRGGSSSMLDCNYSPATGFFALRVGIYGGTGIEADSVRYTGYLF